MILLALVVLGYIVLPVLQSARAKPHPNIVLYGFSVLTDVMTQAVFPAFQKKWQEERHEEVEFTPHFGASGAITNETILGAPAQLLIVSTERDAKRLVEKKTVDDEVWKKLPNNGTINGTPFVIVVRKGNPKQVGDFADLTKPGIKIIHPDPQLSGGAQWGVLAEYGSALFATGDKEQAAAQLLGIWRNVESQAPSAAAAHAKFDQGFGDVLITYEHEALRSLKTGKEYEIIYPERTILSEHTIVPIAKNIGDREREAIEAFVQFLWSDEAQRLFVGHGLRSVVPELNAGFAQSVAKPFRVSDLGGWDRAYPDIIEGVWNNKVLVNLQ